MVDLGLVLGVCSLFGIISSKLNQPTFIGYLAGGLLLAWVGEGFADLSQLAQPLGELGIIFLLFLAGMEIETQTLLNEDSRTFLIGIGQIIFTFLLGYFIVSYVLKFPLQQSIFLAIVLTFSSTIVVLKTLGSNNELKSPHGRILLYMLVIQDIVAILAIILFDPTTLGGGNIYMGISKTLLTISGAFAGLYLFGAYILRPLFSKIAESFEAVFITGLTWCFAGVLLAHFLNFSVELGAFLAGIAIADFTYTFEIVDKTKPLREFGLILFFSFLALKAEIGLSIVNSLGFGTLLLFVILSTPLLILILGSMFKIPKKTIFKSAFYPAQSSEFSLVLATLGVQWGIIGGETLGLISSVTIGSILLSSVVNYPHLTRFSR